MQLPRGARPVPGWPGYYVTKTGRVFSTRPANGHPNAKQKVRELKTRLDGRGYLDVDLHDGRGGHGKMRVHRLLLMAFVGPPPSPKHLGRHLNDIKTDNRLENLAWGTDQENKADAKRNGRLACGEQVGTAKLTERQVRKIHALGVNGLTIRQIAERLSVECGAVGGICVGRTWRHLQLGPARPRRTRAA